MALLGKKDEADDGESAASAKGVASRLKSLEERGFTGAVEVRVKGCSAEAQLYLYEGGIYAVHLAGYGPVLMDRLRTDGVLDDARWRELAAIFGPHRAHPRVGPMAVEQEWMTLDELVNVHQEFLIAGLGAVLAVPKARVERESNATTGAYCSLPQDLPRLLRLVQGRQQRTSGAWAAMNAPWGPAELVLRHGGAPVPSNLDRDEFAALLAAVDGERSVDEVAAALGLTRGEAIRAASLLVLAGTLEIDRDRRAEPPADLLLVPEAWGGSLDLRPEVAPPEPAPRLAPVGAVATDSASHARAWLPASAAAGAPAPLLPSLAQPEVVVPVAAAAPDMAADTDVVVATSTDPTSATTAPGAGVAGVAEPGTTTTTRVTTTGGSVEDRSDGARHGEHHREHHVERHVEHHVERYVERHVEHQGSGDGTSRTTTEVTTQVVTEAPGAGQAPSTARDPVAVPTAPPGALPIAAGPPPAGGGAPPVQPPQPLAPTYPTYPAYPVAQPYPAGAPGLSAPLPAAPAAGPAVPYPAAPAPAATVTDPGEEDPLLARHRRLQEATEQALLLEQLLSESIAVEREALERSAVIRQRLRETLSHVASLTSGAAVAPDVAEGER